MGQTTFSGPVASQNGFIDASFTTAERDAIADPQAGLLIYNTDDNEYQVYNGTGWQAAFGPAGETYTQGVDYSNDPTLGLCFISGMGPTALRLAIVAWSNAAGAATLMTHNSGSTFDFTINGTVYTFTATGNWTTEDPTPGQEIYQLIGTWTGSSMEMFTPVTTITVL